MLDDRVRRFISEHPDAVVVVLGAGLDTGMVRVDPPAGVDWYDVDLPNVIALRDQLVPADDRAHSVAASLADDAWTDPIPSDRPTMLIADGLLAFLTEPVIVNHVPPHPQAFSLRRIGDERLRESRRAQHPGHEAGVQRRRKSLGLPGFRRRPGSAAMESAPTLVEETSLAHAPEVDQYPLGVRVSTRLMGMTKAGARTARILRYRF